MKKHLLLMLLFLGILRTTYAQDVVIGKVTDEKGAALSGVSVLEKGTRRGVSTASDGTFSLKVKKGAKLVFSGVGFADKEVAVTGGEVNVSLSPDTKEMGDVVVTALGIKKDKRQLTYSTQEVKGESLVAAKQDNIVNGLAGKVSGVQITNSSGMAGSSARIVIRGAGSLTGDNQPLFVIDGIPMDNNEAGPIDPTNIGAANAQLNYGSTSNRAIDIDPNIIESVNILKGAAATALYGSAAGNGAVIITTKTASRTAGKSAPSVTFSSNYSIDNGIFPEFQDKYAQGLNGLYIDGNNGKRSSASWGPLIDTLKVNGLPVAKHDPRAEFFKTGHTFENNISVSGAGEKSQYLLSYSYLKTDGISPNNDFLRHSVFGKFSNHILENLTANIQFNYIYSDNNRLLEGNGLANPLWTVYSAPISWNPLPYVNADGSQQIYRNGRNNPYYLANNTGYGSVVNRFIPVGSIVYQPLKWLTFTERLGADVYIDQAGYHESTGVINGVFNNNGGLTNRVQTFRRYNHDFIIEAQKKLSNDLNGSIVVGNNIVSTYSETYAQTGIGLSIDNFYNMSNATTVTASDNYSLSRKVGYYAQVNLEYKKLLNLALTGRYDGTSVLDVSKQYYTYGSAAVGFIFTELMKDKSILNFGKARISYSAVGNDAVSPYSTSTPFYHASGINNINFPFGGQNGFAYSTLLGNPNLKNESLNEFEAGLELKFLKNRISFEGSYFIKTTNDLLTPINTAASSGFTAAELNAGSIENKGIELLVSATPVKTKDFAWDISVNFTKIKNNVLSLAPGVANIQFGGFNPGGVFAFPGQPYGAIYGYAYSRNANGKILVDDSGIPIVGDPGIIGNVTPDFTAGMSNTLSYKGLSLSFVFDWKQGGDIYNLDDHYNWFYGTPKITENRNTPILVDGIRASDNTKNTTTVSAQDYYRAVSSIDEAVIEKATYIKLRSLNLAYTFNKSLIKSTPFKSVVVSLSGNNLWIYKPSFTGSDPEASLQGSGNGQGIVNYMTPTSRSFILGLKLTF